MIFTALAIFDEIFYDFATITFGNIALFILVLMIIGAIIMFNMNIPSGLVLAIIGLFGIGMFVFFGDNRIIKIVLSVIAVILGVVVATMLVRLFNDR